MNDRIEIAKNIIKELLEKGFGDKYKVEFIVENDELQANISGENVSYLIGLHGQTLQSFQMLARQIYMNQTNDYEDGLKIRVDIDSYRLRRIEKLKELVSNAIEKVKEYNKEITLPVMNAYERRIIHSFVQESFPEIKTQSVGEEPNRQVCLMPVEAQSE